VFYNFILCRPGGDSTECSGHGRCNCGRCECDTVGESGTDTSKRYTGDLCECNDYTCEYYNGELCGGTIIVRVCIPRDAVLAIMCFHEKHEHLLITFVSH